jgi:hypothetical protein
MKENTYFVLHELTLFFLFFNKCINECVTISLNTNKNKLVVKQVSRQLILDWGLMIDKCSTIHLVASSIYIAMNQIG